MAAILTTGKWVKHVLREQNGLDMLLYLLNAYNYGIEYRLFGQTPHHGLQLIK